MRHSFGVPIAVLGFPAATALVAFDRIIGLDLDHVALDGSLHKAPYGGDGTGPNPTDRAKLGGSGLSRRSVTASRSAGDRRRQP